MSEGVLYALKKDGKYLRTQGFGNEYSQLERAWLLSLKSATSLSRYYPESEIVKIRLTEVGGANQ